MSSYRLAGGATVLTAAVAVAVAAALAGCGGSGNRQAAVSASVQAAVLPAGSTAPATALETDPARARSIAGHAVGTCLARAWRNAGFGRSFGVYAGNGMVQFATGSRARPVGNLAQATLITVRVYTDGTVAGVPDSSQGSEGALTVDNRALSHWGCAR